MKGIKRERGLFSQHKAVSNGVLLIPKTEKMQLGSYGSLNLENCRNGERQISEGSSFKYSDCKISICGQVRVTLNMGCMMSIKLSSGFTQALILNKYFPLSINFTHLPQQKSSTCLDLC